MKTVRYSTDALKGLRRHGNVSARIRVAIEGYAEGKGAHANQVTRLVGSSAGRIRVGDFRAIFEETDSEIIVTRIGPRGDIYDWETTMDADTITLTRAEYEDIIDARDHAIAMRDIASGAMETLTSAEVDAYLAAPTPLAFWRKRRGLTQAALATRIDIAQPSLAMAEKGRRGLSVSTYAKLAKVLGVRIEDLLPDE